MRYVDRRGRRRQRRGGGAVSTNFPLKVAPPLRAEQVTVPGLERIEQLRGNSQKWQPLLGENVIGAYEKPRFGAEFLLFIAGNRQIAEIAFAQ